MCFMCFQSKSKSNQTIQVHQPGAHEKIMPSRHNQNVTMSSHVFTRTSFSPKSWHWSNMRNSASMGFKTKIDIWTRPFFSATCRRPIRHILFTLFTWRPYRLFSIPSSGRPLGRWGTADGPRWRDRPSPLPDDQRRQASSVVGRPWGSSLRHFP